MSIINIQTAADALLCYASAASFANCFFLSYSAPYFLQSSSYASEQPKRRWSCLGQGCSKRCWTVESAAAGTWSWFSHGRLIPLRLVFHVFAKLLFSLVVVMMCNPPESVHFALELCYLSLVQLWGALLIQGIGWRILSCCLALTACCRSCISVLVDFCCSDLVMLLLLLQLGQLVFGAHDRLVGLQQCYDEDSVYFFLLFGYFCHLKDGFGKSFSCWQVQMIKSNWQFLHEYKNWSNK